MRTVLIVDDSSIFRQLLRQTLNSRCPDWSVTEAENGDGLLQKIDPCPPDLVLMDIHLREGKSGLELTKEIKESYPLTPVAVITNYDLPEYEKRAFELGADYFMPKGSFTSNMVVSLVRSAMRDKGQVPT